MFDCGTSTTLCVSQKDGNDHWAGFYSEVRGDLHGPLQSIEKALEKIADMRFFGALQPVSVVICNEVYCVKKAHSNKRRGLWH